MDFESSKVPLGGREMESPVSSSRGPMGSLIWKLDWLESQRFLRNPVRRTFELLKEDLKGIDTFLLELSNECDPDLMKKYWMKEVREICYDTEDYIDWLIHSELKIGSVGVVRRLKISRLLRTLNPRPNIASQIKEFRARLQDAGERHKRYILDNNISPSSSNFMHSHWIPEWSREAASILVGIDDSKEKLIKLLNNGEKQLNVISISGLGGIGKTTLAKQILQELGWKFGCHAFVRASRKPDSKNLLRSILSQTGRRQHSEACNLQQLIDYLREHLRHTRYLIVIDDLWDTAFWDFLLRAFPDGTQSSRIIITTASENVAMTCCGNRSDYILKMEPLNDNDSRKIFFTRVFGSENSCPQQFKDASYEIVRKCGGVPLAIIHIAGLLTHQQDKSEVWGYVETSLGSNLSISPTYDGMRKVMNLSYNCLPQCLKTCLQYVCMYPENCTILKDDLVRRWVAEGFIEGDRERGNEAIAQSHFEELVYRGMIQAIDMNYNDQVLSCTVHHMVLDFVTSISAEDNFITSVDYSKNARELCSKVRRLLLFYSSAKYAATLSGMTPLQVRSLAFYGLVKCLPSIWEFKFLRVLVIHLWGDHDDSTRLNLSGIHRLFLLKYLKVTCNFCVQLPTHMWGLNLLETLEINAKESSVPEDIVHLKHLAHLCLPAVTMLAHGMSRLRSLRTLKHFDLCGSSDEEVESLKELSVLEELQLVLTTAPADSVERNLNVLFSILWVLDNLKSLALVRGASVPEDSVPTIDSSSMSCPTDCLERLELHRGTCILSRLPRWIGQLGSLCILKLGVLKIRKHDVDSLAGLQLLKFLSLYVRRPMVEQMIFSSGTFPALECFKFRSSVLCIAFRPGAMPKLHRLKLCFNAYSGEYSDNMLAGIEHLLNLQEVSGRIGVDVGAKESDKMMAEYAFKDAISRHLVIPRFNAQIVNWIEDDHVPAKNIILSKNMKVDHGILVKESEVNTNKNTDGWVSAFSDTVVTFSDHLSSEAPRTTNTWKDTKLPTGIVSSSSENSVYEKELWPSQVDSTLISAATTDDVSSDVCFNTPQDWSTRGSELSALNAEPKLEDDFLSGISFSEQHHKANCNMIPSTSSTACYASSGATTGYHQQLYHQPTSSALNFADSIMACSAGVHDGGTMLSVATASGGTDSASVNDGGSIRLSMIKNWLESQPASMQPRVATAERTQGLSLSMNMAGTTQGAAGMPLLAGERSQEPESVSTSAQRGGVVMAPKEDSGDSGVAGTSTLVAMSTDTGGSGTLADTAARKTVDTLRQHMSIYRGVTRHRWTGRYEAHLWDNSCIREGQSRKGRQVYLGGYDKEEIAARAYDLAALKYWGPTTPTNFPVSNYEKELEDMKHMTRQEFVASLRRKSSGFSRGASIYRGVTRHHQHGRWQARIGRVAGNKDLYLGTFSTQEEAAEAYDIAAIKFRGLNAVTNFDMSRYDVTSILESNALPIGSATKHLKEAEAATSAQHHAGVVGYDVSRIASQLGDSGDLAAADGA